MIEFRLPRIATLALTIALIATGTAAPMAAATAAPRHSVKAVGGFSIGNRGRNAVPTPNYNLPCWANGAKNAAGTNACHVQEVAAINHQHDLEGISSITLPNNFWTLTSALQTFVITDLERVSRGLKPFLGVNSELNTWAAAGAAANTDPSLTAWDLTNGTKLQTFSAIWASDLNPLDADFIWMYADGWAATGSYNSDCTSPSSGGCWSHRKVILSAFGNSANLVAGVGSVAGNAAQGALNSDAETFATYSGPAPVLMYTWAQAVALGAV